jgi:hypothetical protein
MVPILRTHRLAIPRGARICLGQERPAQGCANLPTARRAPEVSSKCPETTAPPAELRARIAPTFRASGAVPDASDGLSEPSGIIGIELAFAGGTAVCLRPVEARPLGPFYASDGLR